MLDAFAGSGALGFEAASRGAAEVLLLDNDPVLVDSLRESRQRLDATALRVERADAMAWMARSAPARFELVLLDPPFDAELAGLATAAAMRLLVEGGFLYVESAEPPLEALPGLTLHRSLRAGAVHAGLYLRAA